MIIFTINYLIVNFTKQVLYTRIIPYKTDFIFASRWQNFTKNWRALEPGDIISQEKWNDGAPRCVERERRRGNIFFTKSRGPEKRMGGFNMICGRRNRELRTIFSFFVCSDGPKDNGIKCFICIPYFWKIQYTTNLDTPLHGD